MPDHFPDTTKMVSRRIQRSRATGWRMPPGAVYVGRPSRWANPWTVAKAREAGFGGTDAALAALCANFFAQGMRTKVRVCQPIIAALPLLRGKHLACWCRLDQPCHADVLLELANA